MNTVKRSQVVRLSTEAAEAGDSLMVETCQLALGAFSQDAAERKRRNVRRALSECARVISNCEAQKEGSHDRG